MSRVIRTEASVIEVLNAGCGGGEVLSVGGSRGFMGLGAVREFIAGLASNTTILTGATHGVDDVVRRAALQRGLELGFGGRRRVGARSSSGAHVRAGDKAAAAAAQALGASGGGAGAGGVTDAAGSTVPVGAV